MTQLNKASLVNFAFLMRLIKAFWEIDELSTQRQF
jgi:hypothetical protein